jgi:hypothetical protein
LPFLIFFGVNDLSICLLGLPLPAIALATVGIPLNLSAFAKASADNEELIGAAKIRSNSLLGKTLKTFFKIHCPAVKVVNPFIFGTYSQWFIAYNRLSNQHHHEAFLNKIYQKDFHPPPVA